MVFPLCVAHLVALGVLQSAVLLLWLAPAWAPLPIGAFLVFAGVSSLLPGFSFFLPIVSRGPRDTPRVGLSFDDGPDPAVTPLVLDLLDRFGMKAAFFLVGVKAEAHPDLVREILARGHEIGSHSWSHDPLLMLRGRHRVREEVRRGQESLRAFGVLPMAFRPPVGVTAPPLWRPLIEAGMFCLNFSLRAGDMGNRRIRGLAQSLLRRVRPGDLILLHDVRPPRATVPELMAQFETLLEGLRGKGLGVVPVSALVGRQLMKREVVKGSAAESFYDDLAASYDQEQFETGVSLAVRTEQMLFEARLPEILPKGGRALEIGAGTGIFTLPIARRAREVLAVDLSRNMLDRLEAKARAEGMTHIVARAADVETADLAGPFDMVCAFSALEYLQDLPGLLKRVAPELAPGGHVYLLTARRSLFRLFTQIGNALRQGLWLRARSRREMARMLREAGLEVVSIEGHLLKGWGFGGMLLEVVARRPK